VNPEQLHRSPPFSLLGETLGGEHARIPSRGDITAISRVGINVYFPARHCPDYLSLLGRDIALKAATLPTRGAVASLWLRGYPLRQLPTEALTELVFRLCSRFNLRHSQGVVRGIDLGPEHCLREHLALVRGLGFDVVRLVIDATIATADRGLDQCQRALAAIDEFQPLRLRGTVLYGTDTNTLFADRLMGVLARSQAEEIELIQSIPPVRPASADCSLQRLFEGAAGSLEAAGYLLFGDRTFKHPRHGDVALRDNHHLSYGPWGFYNSDIANWLGLGIGADGISEGYLYHNTQDPARYRQLLDEECSPIASWSPTPIVDSAPYRLIQALFCHHRADLPARLDPASHQRLLAEGWIIADDREVILTPAGARNLQSVLRLLCDHGVDDHG
jgi:hypothetical protein